jgi:hypothetical protein
MLQYKSELLIIKKYFQLFAQNSNATMGEENTAVVALPTADVALDILEDVAREV